jgi:hypothetical protein
MRAVFGILFLIHGVASAQATAPSTPAPSEAETGTSNDLFIMWDTRSVS